MSLLSYGVYFPGTLTVLLCWSLLDLGHLGSYIPVLNAPVACLEPNILTPPVGLRFTYDIEARLRLLVPTGGEFVDINSLSRLLDRF